MTHVGMVIVDYWFVSANASGHQELKEIPHDNQTFTFDEGPDGPITEDDDSSQDDSQSETSVWWYFPWR